MFKLKKQNIYTKNSNTIATLYLIFWQKYMHAGIITCDLHKVQ